AEGLEGDGGLFAAGAAAEVVPRDDHIPRLHLARPRRVYGLERVRREHLRVRRPEVLARDDVVGRHVVPECPYTTAELTEHRFPQGAGTNKAGVKTRNRAKPSGPLVKGLDFSRIRDFSMDRGSGHRPRRGEIHLRLRRPHTARIVAVRRGDANFVAREGAEVAPEAGAAGRRGERRPGIMENSNKPPSKAWR